MVNSLGARRGRVKRQVICPHLGLASDPLARDSLPSAEHRCYFQMQRDRIDLDHQQDFCLSTAYRRCPWLAAAPLPASGSPWSRAFERAGLAASDGADSLLGLLDAVSARTGAYARALRLGPAPEALLAWARPRLGPAASRLRGWAASALSWLAHNAAGGARWAASHLSVGARAVLRRSPRLAALLRAALARVADLGSHLARRSWMELARAGGWLASALAGWFRGLWRRRPRLGLANRGGPASPGLDPSVSVPPASGFVLEPSSAPGDLIARGVAALESDREDLAYGLFVQACRRTPEDARAWFWRAKSAPSLDEVIDSLERAAELAPSNAQVRVNLEWARRRREREAAARALERAAARESAAYSRAAGRSGRRTALLRAFGTLAGAAVTLLAASASLVVGVLWIAGALPDVVLRQLDVESSPLLGLMPHLDVASLRGALNLGLLDGYDVLSALPYALGFLALLAAAGLLSRESWARWWAPLVAVVSLALWLHFAAVELPPQALVGLVTLAALAPLSPVRR